MSNRDHSGNAPENTQDKSRDDTRDRNQSKKRKLPSHIAYHARESTEETYFNNIGAAFEHKDKKGFNLFLDAFPKDGKVVLRTFTERLNNLKIGNVAVKSNQDRER